jgi:PAS domain S-box-containing protein
MTRRLSIWVTFLVGITFLAVMLLAWTTYQNSGNVRQVERDARETRQTRNLIVSLLSTLKDAETGQRGYLLTGREEYLAPYQESRVIADALLESLNDFLFQHEAQMIRLGKLKRLVRDKQDELEKTLQLLQESDGNPSGFEKARQRILTDRGHQLMEEIRSTVAEMLNHQDDLLTSYAEQVESQTNANKQWIVLGNGLALALLAAASVAIIMERKGRDTAEQEILNERERFAAIIDSAPIGVVACDQSLRIVVANPRALATLSCQQADVMRESLLRFIPQTEHQPAEVVLNEFLNSTESTWHQFSSRQALRYNGSLFNVDGTVTKVSIATGSLLTILFRDLTEDETARTRIAEQAAILEQISDAVHLRDTAGKISYWNHGSRTLYGWEKEEALGKLAAELMSPEPFPEPKEAWQVVEATGVWQGEMKQVTQSGCEILVEQRRTLMKNAAGESTGQLIINVDVTDRRRAESLARRSQRLESIGTLVGGIAHDLNNLLTPILMGTSLLAKPQSPEGRQHLLDTIRTSAERGGSMIKQLLAFAGGSEGEKQIIDLAAVVHEIEDILAHTLPKTIAMTVDCPPGIWKVLGDSTELTQVFMNLSINARDAMPGGGALAFEVTNLHVCKEDLPRTHLPSSGRYVRLTITDTGSGMSPDVVEQAFDPFFTTKAQGKGTGLGLATSRGIIRAHGGVISIESEVGRGTKFTIYLPAEQGEASQAGHQQADALSWGEGETVLLVDDEAPILALARATLERHGYHVLTANSGSEALTLLQQQGGKLAAAIVDMMMPGLDGPTTMERLRSIQPGLPMIASSGLRRPPAAQAFLPKPYSDQQLLQTVRTVIEKSVIQKNS